MPHDALSQPAAAQLKSRKADKADKADKAGTLSREAHDPVVKGPWTEAEDAKLLELVGTGKPRTWPLVAQGILGRTARQCQDRWR
jgi:hypothetical protein